MMWSVWNLFRPLLAAGDILKLRTAARCWNVGDKYGPYGAVFFSMLEMDQCGRRWHSELPGGNRELTLLRERNPITVCIRRNPITVCIRKFALHRHSAIPESMGVSSLAVCCQN